MNETYATYEYKVLKSSREGAERALNVLGNDGWMVVGFADVNGWCLYTLMRRKS